MSSAGPAKRSRPPTFLRPRDGRILGGVCAAIARRIGQDAVALRAAWSLPVLVHAPFAAGWACRGCALESLPPACRWLWAASAALAAAAVVAYLLAWLLIPEE